MDGRGQGKDDENQNGVDIYVKRTGNTGQMNNFNEIQIIRRDEGGWVETMKGKGIKEKTKWEAESREWD